MLWKSAIFPAGHIHIAPEIMGSFRLLLAIMVTIPHLSGVSWTMHVGVFAVAGFYVVSGYLMTRVLHETYAFDGWRFAANRILRLYPQYIFVIGVSVVAFSIWPELRQFHNSWKPAADSIDVAGNILIAPIEFYPAGFRAIPVSWSLAVELINYAMLWAFTARSQRNALITLMLAIVYCIVSILLGRPWPERYFPFYAAALPFSIGAIIWFVRPNLSTNMAVLAITAWIINYLITGWAGGLFTKLGDVYFAVNTLTTAAMVAWLSGLRQKQIDRILGDLAYPAFLLHFLVGAAVSLLWFEGQRRGAGIWITSIPIILVASAVLAWAARQWIEPIRSNIRLPLSLKRA